MPNSYPFISSLIDDIRDNFSEVRKATVKNYVIIYRYYENSNLAFVSHVFHQMQDYGKVFRN